MTTMYVRVKRKDTTAFVYTDPYEQISALKSKVAAVLGVESELQLSFQDKNLDDSKTVNDSKLENDNVLWALLKNSDGSWESVASVTPTPIEGQ